VLGRESSWRLTTTAGECLPAPVLQGTCTSGWMPAVAGRTVSPQGCHTTPCQVCYKTPAKFAAVCAAGLLQKSTAAGGCSTLCMPSSCELLAVESATKPAREPSGRSTASKTLACHCAAQHTRLYASCPATHVHCLGAGRPVTSRCPSSSRPRPLSPHTCPLSPAGSCCRSRCARQSGGRAPGCPWALLLQEGGCWTAAASRPAL
jgi:hypothetical protein